MHRFVGAPLCSSDDVGRLARGDDGGRRVPLGVGRCLRRGDQDRRDVLRQRLFRGGRDVAEVGRRRRLRRRRARRACGAADRDLNGGGLADEDGVGATRARGSAVAPGGQRLGLIPPAPRAVGPSGPDPGRGAGQVAAGQRDHGKWCGLADFADGDATAKPDQRLLREVGVPGPGRVLTMAGTRVDRPRQDDDGRRDCGEQHRRRGTAGRHEPMLRMCLVVQMVRHAT